ncbi:MAG: transposase [Thermodesulfobacteriota bacterium]|nr:transposase [Thermodesulfobacteriota bacterium]
MARPLRIEYPGAFYHVIHRGNAGEAIFRTKRNREKFLENVAKAVERFGIKIHTYCLMTNHYHFLVETPEANLSRAVQWINVSYAAYFNRNRNRIGHLFQGRFKSILIDADEYLKHLSRYIHLNPLRANMVEQLQSYPWSSYRVFAGKAKAPDWLEVDWLLSLFGKSRKRACTAYRKFVEGVDPNRVEDPEKGVVGGFILGSAPFVKWVKKRYLPSRSGEKEIPQLRGLKPRVTPDDVVAVVSEEFGCDTERIVEKGRKGNTARDVAIYLARDLTGVSGVSLGDYFGHISGAGVTVRYTHVAKALSGNRRLKGRVNRIKKRITNN